MQPLMSPTMHGRFTNLYQDVKRADGDAAQIFVPVGPTADGPARLLFIGQATRGWSEEELADYGTAWRRAAEIVAAPRPRSGYWQVVKRIVTDVHAQAGLPAPTGALSEVIGWSNLVKVGHPHRNPSPGSWKIQADLCVEQLCHEVAVMHPSAAILMTRDFASKEILQRVFGEDRWTNDVPEEDRVAWKLSPIPVVWMNHPRNMGPRGYRDASIETAAHVIGRHLSSGS